MRGIACSRSARVTAPIALALGLCACGEDAQAPPAPQGTGAQPGVAPVQLSACARCHLLPTSDLVPRERWAGLIERMDQLLVDFELTPRPTEAETRMAVEWLEAHAPESVLDVDPVLAPSPLAFQASVFGHPPVMNEANGAPPRISNLHLDDLDQDGLVDVLVSDVQLGALTWIHRGADGNWREDVLGEVPAPARIALADLDADGDRDIAVACLGSIEPTEEPIGGLVVLENQGPQDPLRFVPRPLLKGVARVSDVRTGDIDQDGDVDLAVGMFGLYKSGGAIWLERCANGNYKRHVVLQKNGVSHVPLADVDRDGLLDMLVLVSQQHEEIVLFSNRGKGRFEAGILYKAPHPMFGLSNCELADLDVDGDLDVLFANGDALDQDPFPKPWHGAHWLENRTSSGERPHFEHRELVRFPGAYCVRPGDLDGDGDPDVVVTSMLNRWDEPRMSAIWLENRRNGEFVAHPLDASPTFLVTAEVADLDEDGRNDVLAGGMYVLPPYYRVGRVTLWTQRHAGD
jgi:hypothetical protein